MGVAGRGRRSGGARDKSSAMGERHRQQRPGEGVARHEGEGGCHAARTDGEVALHGSRCTGPGAGRAARLRRASSPTCLFSRSISSASARPSRVGLDQRVAQVAGNRVRLGVLQTEYAFNHTQLWRSRVQPGHRQVVVHHHSRAHHG